MKKLFTIVLFALSLGGYSQQSDTLNIVPPYKVSSLIDLKDVWEIRTNYFNNRFKGHWSGVHIGFNDFFDEDYSAYSPNDAGFMDPNTFKSSSVFLNPFHLSLGLQRYRNSVGLVAGIGFELKNLRLDKGLTIEKSSSGTIQPRYLTEYKENIKSKLSASYLVAPLLLEFQIPSRKTNNRFYFSAGVMGKIRLASRTKVKYLSEDDKKLKLKNSGSFFLNKYMYSLHFRTGSRWLSFFADISMVPLFEEGKGPELFPVTAGVTLMKW